jgi:hypothetical protein
MVRGDKADSGHHDALRREPGLPVRILHLVAGSQGKPAGAHFLLNILVFRLREKKVGKAFFVPESDE